MTPVSALERKCADAFQKQMGGPRTSNMEVAVTAWERLESGGLSRVIGNNPFNLRPYADDAAFRSGVRKTATNGYFSVYPSLEAGYAAAAHRLQAAGSDWRNYDEVVAACKRGDPVGFCAALAHSAWDAGRYGTKNGGPNVLLTVYSQLRAASPAPPSTSTPTAAWERNTMIRYCQVRQTATRMRLKKGTALFASPGGAHVTSMQADADVLHLGPAARGWRAVVVSTGYSYTDGKRHASGLYVPATAGAIVPA